jgi:hypothetical protein
MIATIITILSILVLVLGFSVINLLRKQETAEDIVISYMKYLDNISKTIEISEKKLKELDHKGSFESDDEIGFFFKSVKQIQDILNDFKVLRIKE